MKINKKLFVFDCYDTLLGINSNIAYKNFILNSGLHGRPDLHKKIMTSKVDWHNELKNTHTKEEVDLLLVSLRNDLLIDNNSIFLFEDSIETLTFIRENGHSIILLSNLALGYEFAIEEKLKKFIDEVYYSFEIGKIKPEAECFMYVINNFYKNSMIYEKENIYLIDDKIKNVKTFNSLGMNGIVINRKNNIQDDSLNIISSLTEIKKII